MRTAFRLLAMLPACAFLFGFGVPQADAATGLCPMGGAMIMADIDHDKALAWAKGRTKVQINDAGATDWSVLTFSVADERIAVLVEPGQVFFGVAGRGGETYPRDIEGAFGADFASLKDAVGKTLADLVAAGAVKIDAAEVPAIAGAAGLGVLQKGASGWTLTRRDCQAVDLPTSGL